MPEQEKVEVSTTEARAGVKVGAMRYVLAISMIFEPNEPRHVLGLRWQGLFLRNRERAGEVYASVVADVARRHEEAAIADDGFAAAVGGAGVDGDVLAEDVAAAVSGRCSSRPESTLQTAKESRRRSWRAISVHQNRPSTASVSRGNAPRSSGTLCSPA